MSRAYDEAQNIWGRLRRLEQVSFRDTEELRERWAIIARLSREAGRLWTGHVAEAWLKTLSLPFPDWRDGLGANDYLKLLASELEGWGLDINTTPDSLEWQGAELPVHLEASDEQGQRWLFVLVEEVLNPALELRIAAMVRAALEDPLRAGARIVPLSPLPLPFSLYMWTAGTAGTNAFMHADADTTMLLEEENLTDLFVFAERHFGTSLNVSREALPTLDLIAERFMEGRDGKIPYAWICRFASFLGALLRSEVGDGAWVEDPGAESPWVFETIDGSRYDLIASIHTAQKIAWEQAISHALTRPRKVFQIPASKVQQSPGRRHSQQVWRGAPVSTAGVIDGWYVVTLYVLVEWDSFDDPLEALQTKLENAFEHLKESRTLARMYRLPPRIELVSRDLVPPQVRSICESLGVTVKDGDPSEESKA